MGVVAGAAITVVGLVLREDPYELLHLVACQAGVVPGPKGAERQRGRTVVSAEVVFRGAAP